MEIPCPLCECMINRLHGSTSVVKNVSGNSGDTEKQQNPLQIVELMEHIKHKYDSYNT